MECLVSACASGLSLYCSVQVRRRWSEGIVSCVLAESTCAEVQYG